LQQKALVLFSGGQDSATCLAWALSRFDTVETIGFRYGQRHAVELACRTPLVDGLRKINPRWGDKLGGEHTLDIPTLGDISETALTRDVEIAMGEGGLPNTFVPGHGPIFSLSIRRSCGSTRRRRGRSPANLAAMPWSG